MKKYQKLSVVYLCICACTLIVSIISMFIPTIGVVFTEDDIEAHAAISVFDFIVGDHEARVKIEGLGVLGELFSDDINVFQALYSEHYSDLMFSLRFVPLVGLIMLIPLTINLFLVFYNNPFNHKEKFLKKIFHLPSYIYSAFMFFTFSTWIMSIASLFFTSISDDLDFDSIMEILNNDFYSTPLIIFVSFHICLGILRLIFSKLIRFEIKKMGCRHDQEFTVFPKEKQPTPQYPPQQSPQYVAYQNTAPKEPQYVPTQNFVPHNPQHATPQNANTNSNDSFEMIKKFHELYTQGIISEEEFNQKKQKLLNVEQMKNN